MKKDISSLRSTLAYLEAAGELVTTDVEVDPGQRGERLRPQEAVRIGDDADDCVIAAPMPSRAAPHDSRV